MSIGSIILLYQFHFYSPYYDIFISKVFSWVVIMNLWAVTCLWISNELRERTLEVPIMWIIGSLILTLINMVSLTNKQRAYYTHISKIREPNDFCNHMEILITRVNTPDESQMSDLEGYIQ